QSVQLPPDRVELAVGGHQPRALLQGQRREKSHDQLVRVRRQRYSVRGVVKQSREPTPDFGGFAKRLFPYVVDVFSGVEPRPLVALEPAVGPGLMGMPGEQNPRGDPEPGVMLGELLRLDHESRLLTPWLSSQLRPDRPQI